MAKHGNIINDGLHSPEDALTKALVELERRLAQQALIARGLAADSAELRSAVNSLLTGCPDGSGACAHELIHFSDTQLFSPEEHVVDSAPGTKAGVRAPVSLSTRVPTAGGSKASLGVSSGDNDHWIVPVPDGQAQSLMPHKTAWLDVDGNTGVVPNPAIKRPAVRILDGKTSSTIGRVSGAKAKFHLAGVFQQGGAAIKGATEVARSNGRVFADADDQKDQMLQTITEDAPSDDDHYHEIGFCQAVVKSSFFERLSFLTVCASSVWIAVEIEAEDGGELPIAFEFINNLFCFFFMFELIVQFVAFREKQRALVDKAFLFDTALVLLIVLETWVLNVVRAFTDVKGGGENLQGVVVFRILRVLKVLRLGRVLRQLPELLVIIRGIAMAMKAISIIVMLLSLLVYVGGIFFRVILEGSDLGALRFQSVPMAMGTLLVEGTLSGSRGGQVLREAQAHSLWVACCFLLYVLLANVTVMGILGGILVRTVSTVADVEKAESDLTRISNTLGELWDRFFSSDTDSDSDGYMSISEFRNFITCPDVMQVLKNNDIDLRSFMVCSEFLFQDHGGRMTQPEFKRCLLDHRGKITAKVKDHVDTRLYLYSLLQRVSPDRLQSQAALKASIAVFGSP